LPSLYLHIGYPKTGSSSIQVFLRDNAPTLRELGYYVPLVGQGRVGGHHALVRTLCGLPVPPRQAVHEQTVLTELAAAADRSVLISSEMLTGILRNRDIAHHLLSKLCASHSKIVLVMYVRNQPQFVNSAYGQGVKSFRRDDDFQAYFSRVLEHIEEHSYNPWPCLARELGVELRARPFNKAVRAQGVISDYLGAVDLPAAPSLVQPARINESATPFSVEAARILLDGIPGGLNGLTFLQATRCKLALERAVRQLGVKEPGYCGLDIPSARQLETSFARANERFARDVWGAPWHEIFRDDLGCPFTPNDYRVTGVPSATRDRLKGVVATVGPEISAILKNRFAGLREPWNALQG
jgi:hypothetical protein